MNLPVVTNSSELKVVFRKQWGAEKSRKSLDKLNLPLPFVIITDTNTENCTKQVNNIEYFIKIACK